MKSCADFASLKEQYKDKITIGERTPRELLQWLQGQFDLEEASFAVFSDFLADSIKYSAVHSPRNKENLSGDSMDFRIFRILDTEKNREYDPGIFDDPSQIMIYIVFETKTGYVHTNHQKLLLDLEIRRGITQADFEKETPSFQHFLFCKHAFERHEY